MFSPLARQNSHLTREYLFTKKVSYNIIVRSVLQCACYVLYLFNKKVLNTVTISLWEAVVNIFGDIVPNSRTSHLTV